jgi:tagaturonate reductase
VHEARAAGQDVGPIAVVKTTRDAGREARVAALARPEGFPVIIRGRSQGRVVDETIQVRSVDQAFSAHKDWPAIADLFATETETVISNVGESGYAVPDEDKAPEAARTIPSGFPAKLLALLIRRHAAGGRKLLVLPCELVTGNGALLRRILLDLSVHWKLASDFREWLGSSVLFCDTLVDRIVSAPIEPAGAIAEPYALWAIQRQPGFVAPFAHPSVIITDNLEPYARLKLHILNLGHTILAESWLRDRRRPDETVGMILKDAAIRERLERIYRDEVIPGFAARGMRDDATRYVASTIERFENPFLDHPLRDIAQNHTLKVERRIAAFMAWVREREPSTALPQLTALAGVGASLPA